MAETHAGYAASGCLVTGDARSDEYVRQLLWHLHSRLWTPETSKALKVTSSHLTLRADAPPYAAHVLRRVSLTDVTAFLGRPASMAKVRVAVMMPVAHDLAQSVTRISLALSSLTQPWTSSVTQWIRACFRWLLNAGRTVPGAGSVGPTDPVTGLNAVPSLW